MNRFELVLFKIRSFFGQDVHISSLKNSLLKLDISHKAATKRVNFAKQVFERVAETEARDFEKLKQNTLSKTINKIKTLKDNIANETIVIKNNYEDAQDKLAINLEDVNDLENSIKLLNVKDYSLNK